SPGDHVSLDLHGPEPIEGVEDAAAGTGAAQEGAADGDGPDAGVAFELAGGITGAADNAAADGHGAHVAVGVDPAGLNPGPTQEGAADEDGADVAVLTAERLDAGILDVPQDLESTELAHDLRVQVHGARAGAVAAQGPHSQPEEPGGR